jgi:hypothetical protein
MNINNNENVYLRVAYLSGFNMGECGNQLEVLYSYGGGVIICGHII